MQQNSTISNKEIAIIIPAFNPPDELISVCKELLKNEFSLFIVDDGSTEQKIFKEIKLLNTTIIRHHFNLGQGAALETGIHKALENKKKIFITFDADGQHSVGSVYDLIKQFSETNADIIFGSRFINKGFSKHIPKIKKATLKIATLFDRLLTGIKLSDSHNGLRIFNAGVAQKIHFSENRMAHATEILWLTKKYKWRYAECPVLIQYDKNSQHATKSIEIAIDLFLRKLIS